MLYTIRIFDTLQNKYCIGQVEQFIVKIIFTMDNNHFGHKTTPLYKILKIILILLSMSACCLSANTDWPKIKKLENGCYEFDGVTIDKQNLLIKFKMTSNQRSGLIEYGIVHENGKIHESLFTTKIRPEIIHASLLLLKAKAEGDYFLSESNDSQSYSSRCVDVDVTWESNQTIKQRNLRELYYNHNAKKNTPAKPLYLFTGSRIIETIFMAEHTGSILGVYLDPDAILNSIESNSDNDDLWVANKLTMPPLDQEVTCVLQLPQNRP